MRPPKQMRSEMRQQLSELQLGSNMLDPKKIHWRRALKGLLYVGAPLLVMQLVVLVCSSPYLSNDRDLGQLEFFSGLQAITKAAEKRGLQTYPFDINIDPKTMDFNTPVGFVHAVHSSMRLKRGGWSWGAPVCSTWGKLCLAITLRSAENASGDEGRECVREANKMASRSLATGRQQGSLSGTLINPYQTLNTTRLPTALYNIVSEDLIFI